MKMQPKLLLLAALASATPAAMAELMEFTFTAQGFVTEDSREDPPPPAPFDMKWSVTYDTADVQLSADRDYVKIVELPDIKGGNLVFNGTDYGAPKYFNSPSYVIPFVYSVRPPSNGKSSLFINTPTFANTVAAQLRISAELDSSTAGSALALFTRPGSLHLSTDLDPGDETPWVDAPLNAYLTALSLAPDWFIVEGGYRLTMASLDITTRYVSGVPEPAVGAMLIAGLGIVGMAARRRRVHA